MLMRYLGGGVGHYKQEASDAAAGSSEMCECSHHLIKLTLTTAASTNVASNEEVEGESAALASPSQEFEGTIPEDEENDEDDEDEENRASLILQDVRDVAGESGCEPSDVEYSDGDDSVVDDEEPQTEDWLD
jgi:hypothetical protein